MSWRIRAYLIALSFRHLGIAYAVHADGHRFQRTEAFHYVFELLPPTWWVVVLGVFGMVGIGGALWPREIGIRVLIVLSCGLTFAWAASFVTAGIVYPQSSSTIATVIFSTLAMKDLIVSGMTYSNPLEAIVQRERQDEVP